MDELAGAVQHYAWGDRRFIADLQGRPPSDEPEAELWLGAHPVAPSSLVGAGRSLIDVVGERPSAVLGPAVHARFGRFPFLLKILAAAEPLSIQVHPSRAQASAGFRREDVAGVPWDSPVRIYRDDNHKPELICALTEFEAKCGFRPLPATRSLVAAVADAAGAPSGPGPGGPALQELGRRLAARRSPKAVLSDVLAWLLRLGSREAATMVDEAAAGAERLLASGLDPSVAPHEPELRWTVALSCAHPGDAGVVVALLLNHVTLDPGQAMFLAAGDLHSYLRGAGVELMANSDNVIRGGLTVKHVDVDELVAVVDTSPGPAPVEAPTSSPHRYHAPVPEFALTRVVGPGPARFEPSGPEIVLVTEGRVAIEASVADDPLELQAGEAGFVAFADGPYHLKPRGPATAWRASVGDLTL